MPHNIENLRNNAYAAELLHYDRLHDHQGRPGSRRSGGAGQFSLLHAGRPSREVVRKVAASLSSVVRWEQAYRRDKQKGLRARPTPGRPCRLSAKQQEQLKVLLLRGAGAAGYTT